MFLHRGRPVVCLAFVVLLVPTARVPAAGTRQVSDQFLAAALEQAVATGRLPDDPDLDWALLTPALDALIAADARHPLAVLAQRAALGVRFASSTYPVYAHDQRLHGGLETSRVLTLARPWSFRAEVELSSDGGSWRRIGSFSGGPGCGAEVPPALGPGVHRLVARVHLTFFDTPLSAEDCSGDIARSPLGFRAQPKTAPPTPLWHEVRVVSTSYAVRGRTDQAGRLPDDLLLNAWRTSASALDAALPDVPFPRWLALATSGQAARPADWAVEYCREHDREPDGTRALCARAIVQLKEEQNRLLVVRLNVGSVLPDEQWRAATPTLREAFVVARFDTLDVPTLGDIPRALQVPPDSWPAPDLELDSSDIVCRLIADAPGAALPGTTATPLWIHATIRNTGARDAPRATVIVDVACGADPTTGAMPGRAGAVDAPWRAVKKMTRDIRANDAVAVDWTVSSPCATPLVMVGAQYSPLAQASGWGARFEDRLDNNFAAVRVGTGERLR